MKSYVKKKNSSGIALLEFSIVAPVIFMMVLGMVDLFTYLYLSNILEARAHRALEVASWVPDLSKEKFIGDESSPILNDAFKKAKDKIISAAVAGEISALFSEGRRASLQTGDGEVIEKTINYSSQSESDYFSGYSSNKIVVIVPEIDASTGNRDVGFSLQPIGVRVNAVIKPLTPFLPQINIKGEAWGYREDYSASGKAPMFDCTGKPFNPNNLPDPNHPKCQCGGSGINPLTGQCGCPDGKIWGVHPETGNEECICNIALLGCNNGQLIDYENCKCGQWCPVGAITSFGQKRMDNNTCGCKNLWGPVNETATCKRNVCTIENGVTVCKDITSGCSNANCYDNTHFSTTYCGCWCTRLNSLISQAEPPPSDGSTLYQYINQSGIRTSTFTDPNQACNPVVCDQTGVPSGFIRDGPYCLCRAASGTTQYLDQNGNILQHGEQNCPYTCQGRTWHGRHELANGKCQCKAGYTAATNVFNLNQPVDCCPASTCTGPYQKVYVDNLNGARACLCDCSDDAKWDPKLSQCVPLNPPKKEGGAT